jgi:hypothetical protein
VERVFDRARLPEPNEGSGHIFRDQLQVHRLSAFPTPIPARELGWDDACFGSTLRVDDYRHIELLYVGADYLSFEQTDWSSCGSVPGGSTTLRVVSLDQTDKPIPIDQALGQGAYDAVLKRAEQYLDGFGRRSTSHSMPGPNDWAIARHPHDLSEDLGAEWDAPFGRWWAISHLPRPGRLSEQFFLPRRLPKTLSGERTGGTSLSLLPRMGSLVDDFIELPNGRLFLTRDSPSGLRLQVRTGEAAALVEVPIDKPVPGGVVVSAQLAPAEEIPAWTSELSASLKTR